MNLGQNIRARRREKGITQEALAEHLNLTVSAVSQWECGKTSPDISQIPLLCHLLEVTSDALLGIDVDRKAERIQAIYDAAQKQSWEGCHGEAIAALRQGLVEYPGSYRLMEGLVGELFCYTDTSTNAEVVALCDKILEGCTDDSIRQEIWIIICRMFPKMGRREDALRIAKAAPGYQNTSDELVNWIYTGDELLTNYRENMLGLAGLLMDKVIRFGMDSQDDDESLAFYEKGTQIMRVLFDDEDGLFDSQRAGNCHKRMMEIYARRSDAENTLAQLEYAAKYAVEFDTYDQNAAHTSLLFRGIVSGGWIKWEPDAGHRKELLEELEDGKYDFVRGDARFAAVKAVLVDR